MKTKVRIVPGFFVSSEDVTCTYCSVFVFAGTVHHCTAEPFDVDVDINLTEMRSTYMNQTGAVPRWDVQDGKLIRLNPPQEMEDF